MQIEKDLAIRISMDMAKLKSSMKELQATVEHNFEKIEAQTKRSSKKMFSTFDQNTEKMEDSVQDLEKQTKKSADKMDDAFDGISFNLSGKFSNVLRNVGGLIANTFSTRAVYDFGKACVDASADLEAMNAAFDQVMQVQLDSGEMKSYTQDATKYLQKMCDEFDMEINTLKGDYSSFVSQFKGLGFDMEDSLGLGADALTLAADAAAMFNQPMEEAIEHVRSFVKGNYIGGESIQLFGSETMMKQWYEGMDATEKTKYGLEGLNGEWKDLVENQKQLIRINFAKHQYELAGVTGQASREAGLYQNQLTKIKQQWTDFKASVGDAILPKVTEGFKKLSEVMENFKNSSFMETIGESAIDTLAGAFGKLIGWIEKIDWSTLGMQLETISGYVGEFLGSAWDVLTDTLAPIIEDIMEAFGIDVDVEGMDSVNKFLLGVKPMFKWLADHGEEVAEAVIEIGKAWATWKTINVTLGLGQTLMSIKKMGLSSWLVEKIFGLSSGSTLGSAIAGGLSGASGAIAALTIPIVLSFTFDWWGTDEQKDAVEEKVNERFGMEINKDRKTGKTGTNTGGFKKDMKEFAKEWDKFWEDFSLVSTGNMEEVNSEASIFEGDIMQSFGKLRGWVKGLGEDWDKWWKSILDGTIKKCNEIKDWFGKFPQKLASALAGKDGTFTSAIGQMFENALLRAQTNINKLIGMINDFLKSLGLETRLSAVNWYKKKTTKNNPNKSMGGWQQEWAKGTDNAPAGRSLVGEAGRELIADPKLGVFMANSPMVVDLSRGATVLKNSTTESLLRNMGIKAYAKGKNEGSFWDNIWDYLKKPNTVTDKIIEGIGFGSGDLISSALSQWVKGQARGNILSFIKNTFASDEVKNSPNNPNNNKFGGTGAGFGSAMTWARQALAIAGYRPMMQQYKDFMTAFKIVGQHESGYNNAAINLWDSNARKGTPSAGWLQFIEPTFRAYARSGYTNWSNGMHQALAFINYANRKYGGALGVPGVKSILRGGSYKPYANGGLITNPTMALMGEAGTEAVVPLSNAKALKPFGQSVLNAIQEEASTTSGGTYEFTIPLFVDGRQVAIATATYTKEELEKLEKRTARRNGKK